MKILIIQLARLGDILMTWPQVRSLRRSFPDAQIDMLVRPRFKVATEGLTEANRILEFPVEKIFEPLFNEPLKIEESLKTIENHISDLRNENYTWIINCTLSPASSYLTHALQNDQTKITGYTRTSDGYLAIADDISAYIYAQIGIDRDNRIHLADLLTLMIGNQPTYEDWKTKVNTPPVIADDNYVVLHVGASRGDKKLSAFKWRMFISHFAKLINTTVILVGNSEESNDASFISLGHEERRVIDLTGKLKFGELFPLIANARLYIGSDSAPLHIASLVGTLSLNVSLASVNFWETGPKSPGSRVLFAETEADLPAERIAIEAFNLMTNVPATSETIQVLDKSPSYAAAANTRNNDWSWDLVQAIYMGNPWPRIHSNTLRQGLKNLFDVNQVILEQFDTIRKKRDVKLVSGIIERCEDVIESVGKLVPELSPLIRWYQTQKSMIGPDSAVQVIDATEQVHKDFGSVIQYWQTTDSQITEDLNGTTQP